MDSKPFKQFSDLPWESRFVADFPGDPEKENFTRPVSGILYSETAPTPVSSPSLLAWSSSLAAGLGIERPNEASLHLLSGNRIAPAMKPYAARYGGHQFGHWAGQLGDGRAITLGEVAVEGKGRFEFQLKGAGPTPYSRRADGRAVLRSSIREFLCSEAMHFLGVPTTRALSLVGTGEALIRDLFYNGNAAPEPGAIVCRVAPSFLRFGNFEILADSGEVELLGKLADRLILDHYPEIDRSNPDRYGMLLDAVSTKTATLLAHWMRVGFVHGVMNTDNMSALGLTIDYGPYGWLEDYNPGWTPNTTDSQHARYRYGGQPSVALWNLQRFGESLLPLIRDEKRVGLSMDLYRKSFGESYGRMLAQKLGLSSVESEADQKLVADLFGLLQSAETDFTVFFRKLSDLPTRNPTSAGFLAQIEDAFYSPKAVSASVRDLWDQWGIRYLSRVNLEQASPAARSLLMKSVNPKYVPRNYLAQNAIIAATAGDLSVLERLMRVLEHPYEDQPGEDELAAKRPDWARDAPGCSALSCSS